MDFIGADAFCRNRQPVKREVIRNVRNEDKNTSSHNDYNDFSNSNLSDAQDVQEDCDTQDVQDDSNVQNDNGALADLVFMMQSNARLNHMYDMPALRQVPPQTVLKLLDFILMSSYMDEQRVNGSTTTEHGTEDASMLSEQDEKLKELMFQRKLLSYTLPKNYLYLCDVCLANKSFNAVKQSLVNCKKQQVLQSSDNLCIGNGQSEPVDNDVPSIEDSSASSVNAHAENIQLIGFFRQSYTYCNAIHSMTELLLNQLDSQVFSLPGDDPIGRRCAMMVYFDVDAQLADFMLALSHLMYSMG